MIEFRPSPISPSRAAHLAGAGVVLLAIVLGSLVRVQTTFSNPSFDRTRAEGQLMSDPALLYYLTERIVESGGLPPPDFRADLRLEHPEPSDLPAMFEVGQEFFIAWTYRLFGGGMPLHTFCVIAMGVFASLAAIGAYGLALELTGRVRWAVFAVVMYAITRANYRTIGFILIREDFSLPWLALHLWLLARAARRRTPASYALAALALAVAVATWHAMGFVVALEAAAVFAWFLRTGQNPLAARWAWLFPALLGVASLAVPVLWAKLFLLSLPMQVLLALGAVALLDRWRDGPEWLRRAAGVAFFLVACTVAVAVTRLVAGEHGDYGHVFELMWSKLRTLGVLPADPTALSFGARLLWQGPFETGSVAFLYDRLWVLGALLVVALLCAAPGWLRGRGDARVMVLMGFAFLGGVAAVLVQRLTVLEGLLAPVVVAVLLSSLRLPSALPWMLGLSLAQLGLFSAVLPSLARWTWYQPIERRNLTQFLDWARDHTDGRSAIATDFINSPAILAHTGHAVILQPKYETRRSRLRIESFVTGFFRDSPWEFHRRLKDEFDCDYLLVDVHVMRASRYQAGIPEGDEPPPGSAASAFLSTDSRIFNEVPGFSLLYVNDATPPTWRFYRIE